jgi:hypothetical protein
VLKCAFEVTGREYHRKVNRLAFLRQSLLHLTIFSVNIPISPSLRVSKHHPPANHNVRSPPLSQLTTFSHYASSSTACSPPADACIRRRDLEENFPYREAIRAPPNAYSRIAWT